MRFSKFDSLRVYVFVKSLKVSFNPSPLSFFFLTVFLRSFCLSFAVVLSISPSSSVGLCPTLTITRAEFEARERDIPRISSPIYLLVFVCRPWRFVAREKQRNPRCSSYGTFPNVDHRSLDNERRHVTRSKNTSHFIRTERRVDMDKHVSAREIIFTLALLILCLLLLLFVSFRFVCSRSSSCVWCFSVLIAFEFVISCLLSSPIFRSFHVASCSRVVFKQINLSTSSCGMRLISTLPKSISHTHCLPMCACGLPERRHVFSIYLTMRAIYNECT